MTEKNVDQEVKNQIKPRILSNNTDPVAYHLSLHIHLKRMLKWTYDPLYNLTEFWPDIMPRRELFNLKIVMFLLFVVVPHQDTSNEYPEHNLWASTQDFDNNRICNQASNMHM